MTDAAEIGIGGGARRLAPEVDAGWLNRSRPRDQGVITGRPAEVALLLRLTRPGGAMRSIRFGGQLDYAAFLTP